MRTGGDVDQQEVRTNRTTTTRLNLAIEKKGNSDTVGQFAFLIDGFHFSVEFDDLFWCHKIQRNSVTDLKGAFLIGTTSKVRYHH